MKIKTIDTIQNISESIKQSPSYMYQPNLTNKLDNLSSDFNQEIINEIVLWKTNRYAQLSDTALDLLNNIKPTDQELDEELTREILDELLAITGVRLAMASTILRFKNPNIYQIIDQRVYRIIYGEDLKTSLNSEKNITLYIKYLKDLRALCEKYGIAFVEADRVLYQLDQLINKDIKIKY